MTLSYKIVPKPSRNLGFVIRKVVPILTIPVFLRGTNFETERDFEVALARKKYKPDSFMCSHSCLAIFWSQPLFAFSVSSIWQIWAWISAFTPFPSPPFKHFAQNISLDRCIHVSSSCIFWSEALATDHSDKKKINYSPLL